MTQQPQVDFWEIHAENYLVPGGPVHAYLMQIRTLYPLSIHGVGLSLGGAMPPDARHLIRLRALCDQYEPFLFSEHLACSQLHSHYVPDLLPVPYTRAHLQRVIEHVDAAQAALGRKIYIENPASYALCTQPEMTESAFLSALSRSSGCGILLDVNNIYVSCHNHGWDAEAYLLELQGSSVGEIHLAGHTVDPEDPRFLIDNHQGPVAAEVWQLYARALTQFGPVPTVVEWDTDIPPLPLWLKEAEKAAGMLQASERNLVYHHE